MQVQIHIPSKKYYSESMPREHAEILFTFWDLSRLDPGAEIVPCEPCENPMKP